MSEFFRNQLLYHYGNSLTPDQKLAVLHEEILILQNQSEAQAVKYERLINDKAKEISKLKKHYESIGVLTN